MCMTENQNKSQRWPRWCWGLDLGTSCLQVLCSAADSWHLIVSCFLNVTCFYPWGLGRRRIQFHVSIYSFWISSVYPCWHLPPGPGQMLPCGQPPDSELAPLLTCCVAPGKLTSLWVCAPHNEMEVRTVAPGRWAMGKARNSKTAHPVSPRGRAGSSLSTLPLGQPYPSPGPRPVEAGKAGPSRGPGSI